MNLKGVEKLRSKEYQEGQTAAELEIKQNTLIVNPYVGEGNDVKFYAWLAGWADKRREG